MRKEEKIITNRLKPPKAFFDWCLSQIPTHVWSNKIKTIRSSERTNCEVIKKRLTKRTKLTIDEKIHPFAIILVTSKRIEIQSYVYYVSYCEGQEHIEKHLTNFEQFAHDHHLKISKDWFGGWTSGLIPNYSSIGGPYEHTVFYQNDWKERLQTISELKYVQLNDDIDRFSLDRIYRYRREIEFLQKINADTLAKEVMFRGADMRIITEQWLRKNKPFIKNSTISFIEYELQRKIAERNGKVVPGIEKYLDYICINRIPKNIGIVSFQNWVIKNKVNFKYYTDYLTVMKDLGVAVDTRNTICPKDLTKAHDDAVKLLNEKNIELEERGYEKRLGQIKSLEFQVDHYCFVVPKKINDLVTEGKALHHCVGSSGYVKDHKSGKTTIIFVRKEDDPGKPFFTLEYRDNRIIQIRGSHNIDPPAGIKAACTRWLVKVNESKKVMSQAG